MQVPMEERRSWKACLDDGGENRLGVVIIRVI